MSAISLYWMRRDLRLEDNPALLAACESGAVVPVFILDPETQAQPAAPVWRLGLGVAQIARTLEGQGSRLILRRGNALATLLNLAKETGAQRIVWNRLYDPAARRRDTEVKDGLRAAGLVAQSFNGHLIHEPWTVETGSGGFYKVYTPFWKAVRGREVPGPQAAPSVIPAPARWPSSDSLADWNLGRAMGRGADIVRAHIHLGAGAAHDRLARFLDEKIDTYDTTRDMLAQDGTSGLSENLTYGEISARQLWHAGQRAMEQGHAGAETFLKEVIWRDFAYHLVYHTPQITSENWKPQWDDFPWQTGGAAFDAWRQGRTGMQVVDAGLREMYVTGRMHNRARMLVASYLTKHLMTHWRAGLDWFADCLIDWDPASNAMGWQWAAGSGPDASPYFRVFNPETQAEKFDPRGTYRRTWIAQMSPRPTARGLSYFDAIPRSWGMSASSSYPAAPLVGAKEGREAALAAYGERAWR